MQKSACKEYKKHYNSGTNMKGKGIYMNDNKIINGLSLDTEKVEAVTTTELAEFTNQYQMQLRSSPEVQALMGSFDVTNSNAILNFGQEPALEISKVSDTLLRNTNMSNQQEISKVVAGLMKIMGKFDIKDFEEKDTSFFGKLVGKIKSLDDITKKYDNLGQEVEKICINLHRHENELARLNEDESRLYNANVQYYQSLEKYIVAGEMSLEELDATHLPAFKQKADTSGDPMDLQNYRTLLAARDMLEGRIYDLRLAENVALQSMMMIQQAQQGNFMLARTIKSEFIVTIPVFKQGIAQAIMLKKQALIAKDTDAVRQATEEMIRRNAMATANQSKMIANMASRGAVSIETLQESYNTIMQGAEEARNIIADNMNKMRADTATLVEHKQKLLKGAE